MGYHSEKLINELNEKAQQFRLDVLEMIYERGAGHPGGSLSAVEIITALFFHHLKIDVNHPDWPEREESKREEDKREESKPGRTVLRIEPDRKPESKPSRNRRRHGKSSGESHGDGAREEAGKTGPVPAAANKRAGQ